MQVSAILIRGLGTKFDCLSLETTADFPCAYLNDGDSYWLKSENY